MTKALFSMATMALMVLASCGTPNNKNLQEKSTEMVGNDKDEHGCIASAGYTWSSLKNECVRVFEVTDAKLFPFSDETVFMGIVFNADKSKVEIFAPSKASIVLSKKGNVWTDGKNELREEKGFSFYENGVLTHQSK